MKHKSILFAALLVASCAAPQIGVAPVSNEVAISLGRETAEAGPILVMTVTNRATSPICIRTELLQNPETFDLGLSLRDLRGRTARNWEPDLLLPPLTEPVRINPGASVQGRYHLAARVRLKDGGRPFPRGMSAQVFFRYDHCDGTLSLRAASEWQAI